MRGAIITLLIVGAWSTQVTPVQKVLTMMGDMKMKALKEKENEVAMMAKFTDFCEDTGVEKSRAIKEGKEQVEKLSADIQKFDSDAKVLGQEIAKLDDSIALAEKDHKEATDVREKEHADYAKTHADYVESIEDLEVATGKLKKMMAATKIGGAASLLQEVSAGQRMPTHIKNILTAFIAQASSDDQAFAEGIALAAPEGRTYESQAGGIVDMMVKLKDKLEDERTALEQEEMNAQHSYDMMAQSLTDAIAQQTDSRNDKASTKKQMESSSGQAKGDLADTQTTLAEDIKFLSDMKAICEKKQADFEARQKMRAEELVAIDQAIEIISSGAVSGAAGTHLPGLVQVGQRATLVQLRSSTKTPTQDAVQSYLTTQGQRLGSNS